jgi:hypothetical protein
VLLPGQQRMLRQAVVRLERYEVYSVVGTRMHVAVEGVQYAYRKRRVHGGLDLLCRHPTYFASFCGGVGSASVRAAPKD